MMDLLERTADYGRRVNGDGTFVVPASHLYNVHVAAHAMFGQSIKGRVVRGGELVAKGTGMRKEKKKPKKEKK